LSRVHGAAAHFHHARHLPDARIQKNSFHHNFQRCFTLHNSNNALLKDNVAFETIGHCYFFEDAAEELNVLDHNLAINVSRADACVRDGCQCLTRLLVVAVVL
jgi:cell migration-inducing and hyaluronan-binding protein